MCATKLPPQRCPCAKGSSKAMWGISFGWLPSCHGAAILYLELATFSRFADKPASHRSIYSWTRIDTIARSSIDRAVTSAHFILEPFSYNVLCFVSNLHRFSCCLNQPSFFYQALSHDKLSKIVFQDILKNSERGAHLVASISARHIFGEAFLNLDVVA